MKLIMTRSTPAGVLSIEGDLPDPSRAVDVVRQVEAALATAEADVCARHAAAPANHAPVIANDPPPAARFVPCNPEPKTGLELWRWAYNVGACKRMLALGRACGLPHATRRDVYRWSADDVASIYHEIQVKPTKGARA